LWRTSSMVRRRGSPWAVGLDGDEVAIW